MPSVRTVVCFLIAGVLAAAVAGVAGLALAAPAARAAPTVAEQGQRQQSAQTVRAVAGGLAVSIDSVSPQFAYANSTVVVTGTITNDTGAPLHGVQVDLETSGLYFNARDQMDGVDGFSSGGYWGLNPVIGNPWPAPSTLHSGATMSWSASFSVAAQGYPTPYEVYPIEAQAVSSEGTVGDARTFLPYWPKSGGTAPDKLDIAWIWPLIDKPQQDMPQQGTCLQDLATNDLASSFAAGGRLNGLLAAGLKYASSTRLTWAVDPALLSDATVMTQRYKVGGNAGCTDTTAMPPSGAAGTWLNELKNRTAGEPMLVTPYADPDVSALVHSGLDTDLATSYALGDNEAHHVLDRSFGPRTAIAWPADGDADMSVLNSLASDGLDTTVLNSGEMPALPSATDPDPSDYAVTSVTTGISTTMSVLLADSEISTELGSVTAASPASARFSVEQDFLAQTALIAAETPSIQRSVVIAPPRRWDPSEGEAAALLRLTSAPWLRPVSLASLASKKAGTHRQSPPSSKVAPGELSAGYMGKVKSDRASASVYESMLTTTQAIGPLEAAIAATESSAWRGRASKGGRLALTLLSSYFRDSEGQVQIISKNKVILGGTSGTIPVSVFNGLDVPVQVRVRALLPAGSPLSISNLNSLVIIQPQETKIVPLPVHSAALGSTSMQLQLFTRNETPLGTPQSLSIESTRFGSALLIVIAAALGVLVLASLGRWVRRWWRDGMSGADGRSEGAG